MFNKPISQRLIFSPERMLSKPFFEVPRRAEMDQVQGSNSLLEYFTKVHSKGKNFYECNGCKRAISGPPYFKRHLITHAAFNENQDLVQNFEKGELQNQVRCKNCSKTYNYKSAVKHMANCHKKQDPAIPKKSPATSSFEREHSLPFQKSPPQVQRNPRVLEESEPELKKKIRVENIGNSFVNENKSTSLLSQIVDICKKFQDSNRGTSMERQLKSELKIVVENYYAIVENESRCFQKTIQELQKANVKGDNEILRKKMRLLEKVNENLLKENKSLKEINQILERKVADQARELEECKRIIEERSLKIEKQDFTLQLHMKNLEMLRLNCAEEVELWEKKYKELLKIFVVRKDDRDNEIREILKFTTKREN